MNLQEAFQAQAENTRLLIEDDLKPDDPLMPVIWNNVLFWPNGNFYSSGREMKVDDKFLICYVISFENAPKPLLLEETEIEIYESQYDVVRVVEKVPVLQLKNTTPSCGDPILDQLKSASEESNPDHPFI